METLLQTTEDYIKINSDIEKPNCYKITYSSQLDTAAIRLNKNDTRMNIDKQSELFRRLYEVLLQLETYTFPELEMSVQGFSIEVLSTEQNDGVDSGSYSLNIQYIQENVPKIIRETLYFWLSTVLSADICSENILSLKWRNGLHKSSSTLISGEIYTDHPEEYTSFDSKQDYVEGMPNLTHNQENFLVWYQAVSECGCFVGFCIDEKEKDEIKENIEHYINLKLNLTEPQTVSLKEINLSKEDGYENEENYVTYDVELDGDVISSPEG